MWDLGNRGVLLLISVSSGCVLLYNAWGPILAVTISFFLVIYACYSLIVNDSLLSPHAFLLLDYLREATIELCVALDNSILYVSRYVYDIWNTKRRYLRERLPIRMQRRHGSNYQLSTDPCSSSRSSSRLSLIEQLSPIPRNTYKSVMSDVDTENKLFDDSDALSYGHGNIFSKHTSTPMVLPKKSESRNGEIRSYSSQRLLTKKTSPIYMQNHSLSRGESSTYFSPDGSPWGMSISPKLRPKAGGVKTVQTVAGPLLASTRYNIDPKVYTDVTSPGLTTRLTKYATEANNKLTHQSQYGTGQFPKINLHAGSVPMINTKSAKMRMPVTVRIAPPEVIRYSPPERQKILSTYRHPETKMTQSVVQVLREISLKRHASREDVTSDLIKKQRTDGIFSDNLENLDDMKQKRSRDESSKSDEDISPQSKTVRPTKRSKTPSCYDILNSLSSSIHVVSGVKRKAMDFSRSGTPDLEKHFKSLESVQNNGLQISSAPCSLVSKQSNPGLTEKYFQNTNTYCPPHKLQENVSKNTVKVFSKSSTNTKEKQVSQMNSTKGKDIKHQFQEDSDTTSKLVNLSDKLFMRAEPQRNEKLRSLIEEQGNIKAKFTTSDTEEIKKEDIINMRQTSMKARLQSMFDAISGKATSKINPDVVIQAEEVVAVTCSANCATLNSSTTITSINTTPISTAVVVPFVFPSELNVSAAQQVHPVSRKMESSQVSDGNAFEIKDKANLSVQPEGDTNKSNITVLSTNTTNSNTTHVPMHAFGKSSTSPLLSTSSTAVTFDTTFTTTIATRATTTIVTTASNIVSAVATVNTTAITTTTPAAAIMTTTSIAATTVTTTSNGAITSISTLPRSLESCNATSSSVIVSPTSIVSGAKNDTNVIATPSMSTNQVIKSTSTNNIFGNAIMTATSTSTNMASFTPNFSASKQSIGNENAGVPLLTPSSNNLMTMISKTTNNTILSNSLLGNSTAAPTSLTTFGNSSANPQTTKSEIFSFGASVNNAKNVNNFGNAPSTQISSPFNNSSNGMTTTNFTSSNSMSTSATGFNTSVNTVSPSFGAPVTTATFSFGTPALSVSENKPTFSFGSGTANVATTSAGSSNTTSVFGTNTCTSTFGTTATTTAEQQSTVATLLFGGTTASTFGTTNSEPIFGGSTISGTLGTFSNSKLTTPVFGSNINKPTETTTTTSTFFSNTNANTTVNTTTSNSVFGGRTSVFGQTKPTTNFGTGSGVFENNPTPLFGPQTTTAPSFGTTNVTAGTTTLTFGTTNTVSPAFGTQTLGIIPPTQNTATQAFNTSAPIFGTESTSTPAFGTNNQSSIGGFGSTITNAFGGQNTTNLTFGNTNSTSTFGNTNNTSTFGNTNNTSTFGDNKQSPFGVESTPTAFGTSGNVSTNNMFSFGENQKPAQQSTFSFGSNSTVNSSATSNPAPFQFGATTPKPATGFSFSAPPTTPTINFGNSGTPTFNASQGMFSIGSGSTAPRSRNNRPRKAR